MANKKAKLAPKLGEFSLLLIPVLFKVKPLRDLCVNKTAISSRFESGVSSILRSVWGQ
ncbi:hypothetical protein KIS4809_3872 [Bacillus sp. ZZV12-4809]|uniref:hypothetical protein n=1 Tax=Cytobacillus sp. AMY 15.2 TaxID=2939563 RepID=UPI0013F9C6AE|nr:hypothetical protein [Cytobacillus sp. AMY 15.2]KAF0817390.1 hypothetical protein KIS4809_3872 [Bacillus sp. ZZV12-4809]